MKPYHQTLKSKFDNDKHQHKQINSTISRCWFEKSAFENNTMKKIHTDKQAS